MNRVRNIRNNMPRRAAHQEHQAQEQGKEHQEQHGQEQVLYIEQEQGTSGKACEEQCEEHQEQYAKEGSTSGTACQGTSAVHQEKLARKKVRNIRTSMYLYRNKVRCIRNSMPVKRCSPSSSACQQQMRNVKNSMLRNKVSISRT